MRILLITDCFPRLSQTFVINHASALLQAGHDVRLLARRCFDEPKAHPGVRTFGLRERTWYYDLPDSRMRRYMSAFRTARQARRGWRVLRELDPVRFGPAVFTLQTLYRSAVVPDLDFDLIHCHYGTVAWGVLGLQESLAAPLVTSFHGPSLSRHFRLGRLQYGHLFRRGNAFVANSEFTRGWMQQLGCPPAKIVTIPAMAPDLHRPTPDPETRLVGVDARELRLLTVARLVEEKGVQVTLRAVHELQRRGFPVSYTVVGDGPYRRELEQLVTQLEIAPQVRFTGWLDQGEISREYLQADALVCPSMRARDGWQETQGMVLQEAHQYGLVVIGSASGGIPEGVAWGKAGLLFEPGNSSSLADAIATVRRDPTSARRLIAEGGSYYAEKYSDAATMQKTLELYARLISGQPSGDTLKHDASILPHDRVPLAPD